VTDVTSQAVSTAVQQERRQARHLVILLAGVLACAAFLFAQERAVVPRELPSLVLDPAAVAQALAADAAAAKRVPKSAKVEQLNAYWLEQSRADREGMEPEYARSVRADDMFFAYGALKSEVGEPAALALRAAAAEQLDAALDGKLTTDEARDVLGGFPTMLAREGCARDGELVAPRFVVRTLFKARWNLSHGLAADHAFTPIERLAFYGWQALHADRLPIERRLNALEAYANYGGKRVAQSAGVLLHMGGQYAASAEALGAAHKQTGNLRLRNWAKGASPAAD
jgi:hypothetical protein